MKNTMLFLLFILTCFACSKEDDAAKKTTPAIDYEKQIVGRWNYEQRYDITTDNPTGAYVRTDTINVKPNSYVLFNADKTFQEYHDNELFLDYTYTVDGNVVTLWHKNYAATKFTIESLSADRLVYSEYIKGVLNYPNYTFVRKMKR